MKKINKISKIAGLFGTICDAWLIGSGATEETPRDFDIVVPYKMWKYAAPLIPKDAKPNTFGGWKFKVDDIEYDVWPDDIGECMTGLCEAVYHIRSERFYKRL